MRRNLFIIISVLVVLTLLGFLFYRFYLSSPSINSGSTTNITSNTYPSYPYCQLDQLQGNVQINSSDEQVQGAITIKNISKSACTILGNRYPSVNVSLPVDVRVVPNGQEFGGTLYLEPEQAVYSKIYYPNGAQCTKQTQELSVTIHQQVTEDVFLPITTPDNTPILINACTDSAEVSEVNVWALYYTPVE